METSLSSSPLTGGFSICPPPGDLFLVRCKQRKRGLIIDSQNARSIPSCQQKSSKLEQITAGSRGRKTPIGSPGPLVRETERLAQTQRAPDDWYRFLCVSLSELCAKNGQSLCAGQNFNKGSKEVEVVVKEGEERWR